MFKSVRHVLRSLESLSICISLGLISVFISDSSLLLAKTSMQIRAARIAKFSKYYGLKNRSTLGRVNSFNVLSKKWNFLANIADANSASREMLASLESQLANESNSEFEYERYLANNIKGIDDPDNDIAMYLFALSVDTIKTVFAGTELIANRSNLVQTIKQVACIFIAETRYGNLSQKYDPCDQTNIGQIRPPAYKAIFDRCESDFSPSQLLFLGEGTNCKTLHPYEMPYCCEAKKLGEDKSGCDRYHNEPKSCISKEKRRFLEDNNQANELEQISCINTDGDRYWRVPAVSSHSVFASVYYLRIMNYQKMSDAKFASFGALYYNAAGGAEQAGYEKKLETCLGVLNRNSDLIENALIRVETNNE